MQVSFCGKLIFLIAAILTVWSGLSALEQRSLVFADLGTGTSSTGSNVGCPINIYYKSLHGQAIYTAAELNAANIFGPAEIVALGFYVSSPPSLPLPNFQVRMKHTSVNNLVNWQTADGLQTVYSTASYQPAAGGFDMLPFGVPFVWNGTDNLLIDTAFSLLDDWSATGMVRYTYYPDGFRYTRNDFVDQSNVFIGGTSSPFRPNLRLTFLVGQGAPEIVVDPLALDFGDVLVGNSNTLQFTIQNTGDEELTGTINTPEGYAVSQATRQTIAGQQIGAARNTLGFAVPSGITATFDVTFTPQAAGSYDGHMEIQSNSPDEPDIGMSVAGSGITPAQISLDDLFLSSELHIGMTGSDSLVISNLGSQELSFRFSEDPGTAWLSVVPESGTLPGGGNLAVLAHFSSAGLIPGPYQCSLLVASNDPVNPELTVSVALTVVNTPPAIDLPDSLHIEMNGVLTVDLGSYVSDPDGQVLSLDHSGNTNLQIGLDGTQATFTAPPNWQGTENITFSVFDGYAYAYDTVSVTVSYTGSQLVLLLPDSFSLCQDCAMWVDFGSYVLPADHGPVQLSCAGDDHVDIEIDGLWVLISSPGGWCGIDELTFTVSDGASQATDTVEVIICYGSLAAPEATLTLTATGNLRLAWAGVPNALSYQVWGSPDPLGEFILLATTADLFWEREATDAAEFFRIVASDRPLTE